MKKVAILLVLFSIFSFIYSQELGVGLKVAMPIGTFGDIAGLGYGLTAEYGWKFEKAGWLGTDKPVTVLGQVGYMHYGEKDGSGYKGNIIPILVGAKYFFGENLYVSALSGIHIISEELKALGMTITASGTEFGYHVGIGYIMDKIDVDLTLASYGSGYGNLSLGVKYKLDF